MDRVKETISPHPGFTPAARANQAKHSQPSLNMFAQNMVVFCALMEWGCIQICGSSLYSTER